MNYYRSSTRQPLRWTVNHAVVLQDGGFFSLSQSQIQCLARSSINIEIFWPLIKAFVTSNSAKIKFHFVQRNETICSNFNMIMNVLTTFSYINWPHHGKLARHSLKIDHTFVSQDGGFVFSVSVWEPMCRSEPINIEILLMWRWLLRDPGK